MLKHKKIRYKLITQFLFIAVLVAAVGVAGAVGLLRMNRNTREIYAHSEHKDMAASLVSQLNQLHVTYLSGMIDINNPAKVDEIIANARLVNQQMYQTLEQLEPMLNTSGTQTSLSKILESYRTVHPLALNYQEALKAQDSASAEEYMEQMLIHRAAMEEEALYIYAQLSGVMGEYVAYGGRLSMLLAAGVIAVALLAFLVSAALGNAQARKISLPIEKIAVAAKKISQGDVQVDVEIRSDDELDELADSFQKMAEGIHTQADILRKIADGNYALTIPMRSQGDVINEAIEQLVHNVNLALTDLQEAAQQVADASVETAQGAQSLASGTTEQAASIEDLSQTLAQLEAQTKENAGKARTASEANGKAGELMEESIRTMQGMQNAMKEIEESSKNITKIIGVIEDIAFQTKILSLNAAVEAARAGHHGKGFAVVADEVRNLAAKSAQAANETAALIQGSSQKVLEGNLMVERTNAHLKEATESVGGAAGLVDELAQSSRQQAVRLEQVGEQIEQIAAVVNNNSATAEESASAAEELSAQSNALKDIASRFTTRDYSSRYDLPQKQTSEPKQPGLSVGKQMNSFAISYDKY